MPRLTQRQKQAIETRLRIIEKGMELFKEFDYESVKVQDICQQANISVGAFYHHFQSKEDLINKGYKDFDLLLQDKLETSQYGNTFKTIHLIIEEQMKFTQQKGYKIPLQIFKNQLTAQNKYILDEKRYFYQVLNKTVAEGMQNKEILAAMPAKELTELILRIARGIIYDWCLHEGNYDLPTRAFKDLELILTNFKPFQVTL